MDSNARTAEDRGDEYFRVLMIEDDADYARLVEAMLGKADAGRLHFERVDRLSRGLHRLDGGDVDVVLLDLFLPDSEELSTLAAVRGRAPGVPIVVLTGLDDEAVGIASLREGAQDYIVKDRIDGRLLARCIRYAIERQRLQTELEQARRAELRSLIDGNADGIVVVGADGLVRFANPAAETIIGSPEEGLVGRHFRFPLRVNELTEVDGAPMDGEPRTAEVRVAEMQWEGETAYIASIRDVTERKQAEEELRAQGQRDQAILATSMDGFFMLGLDGSITDCNEAFCRLAGYSREELLSLNIADLEAAETQEETARHIQHVMQTGSNQFETAQRRKDGKTVDLEISTTSVQLPEGRFLVAFARDITERKQLEQQLLQGQRLEAIGLLAGGVAHDFNNLLTAITGYADLLLMSLPDGDPAHADVKEIRKAGERAASLTQQLLAFSRRQVLEPKILDLNAIVTDAEKMLQRVIGEDVDLTTILDPDLGHVEADPGQMHQVIMNLAVNARDAMPAGGKLTIETQNATLDEAYVRRHPYVTPGHCVMLAVSDTGAGMDEKTLSQVFEPFFTTKPKGEGTGLGLSTVYGIVKQSGGYIWAYSEPGHGTTFKIYLPVADRPIESADQADGLREALQGKETILLVEDEDVVRDIAGRVLIQSGYTVLEASNGDDALQACQEHERPIDLLLTDVVLPDMGGPDVAARVQSQYPNARILYTSGYTDNAIVHHGILDEGIRFLSKPFTPDELARKVREVLDEPQHSSE